MIKRLFVLNLKALGALYFKTDKKKGGAGKTILFVFVTLYIIATFTGMFFALFRSLLDPFFSIGIGWMYFAFLASTAFGLCVIGTLFNASAQLFGAKDNELLLSMPIKPSAILISRILVMLAFEYAFTAIVAVPAFWLWVEGGYATAAGVLFFIIGIVFLPLMAMALSLLLAWLLGIITSRLRRKNILVLVFSLGAFGAYFYMISNVQKYLNDLISRGEELAQAFRRAMPPFYAFGRSIAEGSIGDLLIFILWASIPFAVLVILLSVNYRKILISNRGAAKVIYKEKTVKAGSAFSALVRKELAHYWNKPFVILNSSLGSLFLLGLSLLVIIKRSDILLYVDEFIPGFGNLSPAALGAVIIAFLNTTNNISASLISLEGRNLWIAKSIPTSPKVIIQSKVHTHMLISGIPCLIASICTSVVLSGNLADWMIIILFPQTVGVLIAVSGLAMNLLFPKLDWTNEIYVVKQGLSATITMFGMIGVIAGLGFAYAFLLNSVLSLGTFLWLCVLLFAIIEVLIYTWLMTSGVKRFEEL